MGKISNLATKAINHALSYIKPWKPRTIFPKPQKNDQQFVKVTIVLHWTNTALHDRGTLSYLRWFLMLVADPCAAGARSHWWSGPRRHWTCSNTKRKKTSMSKEVNLWSKAIRPLFFEFFSHSRPCAFVRFLLGTKFFVKCVLISNTDQKSAKN